MESIETKRLRLRQWNADDFGDFARYYADEDNARYVGGQKDPERAWRHLALQIGHWTLKGFGYWAVDEKATNELSIRLAKRLGAEYDDTIELAGYGRHCVFRHF